MACVGGNPEQAKYCTGSGWDGADFLHSNLYHAFGVDNALVFWLWLSSSCTALRIPLFPTLLVQLVGCRLGMGEKIVADTGREINLN